MADFLFDAFWLLGGIGLPVLCLVFVCVSLYEHERDDESKTEGESDGR